MATRRLWKCCCSGALVVVAGSAWGCAPGASSVVRVADGRPEAGRWIAPSAYAAYAQGAYHEAHQDPKRALVEYRRAAERDPESREIWTRIGALECQRRSAPIAEAFAEVAAIDADYAPYWMARARCRLDRGQLEAALRDAIRAAVLDPDDEETTLLVATIHVARGAASDAVHWLRGLGLRQPGAATAWNALAELARDTEDPVLLHEATEQRERSQRLRRSQFDPSPDVRVPADVDAAILEDDLALARGRAVARHWSAGYVALRAAALGRDELALEQASFVLDADPDDVDAHVATLVVADRKGDPSTFEATLGRLARADIDESSALARALLADLLSRRIDEHAANAFRHATGASPSPP